jgi:hypothetical protein
MCKVKFGFVTKMRGTGANTLESARRSYGKFSSLAFLHQQPQHAPQYHGDQSSGGKILANRHDYPPLVHMPQIVLAIATIRRRERGDFSTPT